MNTLVEIAQPYVEMAHRIVWCTVATVASTGEPRTRVLHPVREWDGERLTGWILTSPASLKARHLAVNPRLSLTYWALNHDTCTADCGTEWDDTPELREAGWERFARAPEPVGYNPSSPSWTSPQADAFGVLRLHPRRLRLMEGGASGAVLNWSA